MPGLSEFNYGARAAGSEAPNIRGINATGTPTRLLRTFEQNPVGTYIGNAPVDDSYFQLFDIDRVEVLKGPQGTLYGAGSLGGAVRIIPSAPSTDRISGDVEVGTSVYAGAGSVGNREIGRDQHPPHQDPRHPARRVRRLRSGLDQRLRHPHAHQRHDQRHPGARQPVRSHQQLRHSAFA